jgi:ABC-type nitrate/sulfonate/bicarbonate transport system permease component
MRKAAILQLADGFLRPLLPLLLGAVILLGWEGSVRYFRVPSFVLPPPSGIGRALITHGYLLAQHGVVTLQEVILGFALGASLGMLVGLAMGLSDVCYRTLYPYVIASIVFPKEALAPLFALWLGFGLVPKVVISAVIAFFPVATGTMRGIHSTPPELDDLFDSLCATPWKRLWKLRLPAALPAIMTALRTALPLSVIGAIVGEFVASSKGIGHLIRIAMTEFSTDLIFAALVVLAMMAAILYWVFTLVEARVLLRHRQARLVQSSMRQSAIGR